MDPDRFSELYRRRHRAVWAYAVRRLPAGTAADVAAEVFAVAWRRRDGTVVPVAQGRGTVRQPIWSRARLAEVATATTFAR